MSDNYNRITAEEMQSWFPNFFDLLAQVITSNLDNNDWLAMPAVELNTQGKPENPNSYQVQSIAQWLQTRQLINLNETIYFSPETTTTIAMKAKIDPLINNKLSPQEESILQQVVHIYLDPKTSNIVAQEKEKEEEKALFIKKLKSFGTCLIKYIFCSILILILTKKLYKQYFYRQYS